MAPKQKLIAQNPLILRCNRLIEAFAKSDDERDFLLDRQEGFLIYIDLDKSQDELKNLEKELESNPERYCLIPKTTFYETKKIMEGFINEKVYDIDTKEKLLDIIQSKDARDNFLEFIYDHHSDMEKWQLFYQERSRIRIIEWLRINHFHFVFEEDLEIPKFTLENVKKNRFQTKAVSKDIQDARDLIITKSKTYYSIDALNPRPKRGRPPKQVLKVEFEPQVTSDIFITVPPALNPFLFIPERTHITSSSTSKFGHEFDLFSSRTSSLGDNELSMASLDKKLAALRDLSKSWKLDEKPITDERYLDLMEDDKSIDFNVDDEDEDDEDDDRIRSKKSRAQQKTVPIKKTPAKPVKKAAIQTESNSKLSSNKKMKALRPMKALKMKPLKKKTSDKK